MAAYVTPAPSGAGVDRSANKPALLPLQKTEAANPNRLNFIWQNQSAGTIQIVLYNGPTDYSVLLAAGGGAGEQGETGSLLGLNIRHTGAIEVRAANGAQFLARSY